jgi:hypothetical protein
MTREDLAKIVAAYVKSLGYYCRIEEDKKSGTIYKDGRMAHSITVRIGSKWWLMWKLFGTYLWLQIHEDHVRYTIPSGDGESFEIADPASFEKLAVALARDCRYENSPNCDQQWGPEFFAQLKEGNRNKRGR